jgi:hypothetical protein
MKFRVKVLCGAIAVLAVTLVPAPAAADFSTTTQLATAMDIPAGFLGSSYSGSNVGASVETKTVAGFPVKGSSYLVLSTGQADRFTLPDNSGSMGSNVSGATGAAGQDQAQLTIRLKPPANAQCFAFDFRFFSEEYPEFVGKKFNDAFTAEIVQSDITFKNGSVVTPWNFAFDKQLNPITINSVAGMSKDNVTTFDGSTPLLSAVTPVELNDKNEVLITLTIQDVGDSIYDSAVAIDNARWLTTQNCTAGIINVGDRDEDGLPNEWEEKGLDVDGDGKIDLDLPAMGADPDRKDLFLEIDWMVAPQSCVWIVCWGGKDFSPTPAAINAVVKAFADAPVSNPDGSTGITLHVDSGPNSAMKAGATWGSRGRGNAVKHVASLGNRVNGRYNWAAFQKLKDANFDDERRDVFHYAIYADRYAGSGSSGISRGIKAADLIVSQGAFNGGSGFTLVQERGTLMHEFGHNLGLRHGGADNLNRKPNYLSIMSYTFQFPGLRVNGADGRLDYSPDLLDPLNEASLQEAVGLGPNAAVGNFGTVWTCGNSPFLTDNAAGPVNWNCAGSSTQSNVSADINGDGFRSTLTGQNDWINLKFDGGAIGLLGQSEPLPTLTEDKEITLDIAKKLGVLTGDFEALLTAPSTAMLVPDAGTRSVELKLANVGKKADTYTFKVAGQGLGVSSLPATSLSAGATKSLALKVNTAGLKPGEYDLQIMVLSKATGTVISTVGVAVTVPDFSDPAVRKAAQDASKKLAALSGSAGPDNRGDILEMLAAVEPSRSGYWMAEADGDLYAFGDVSAFSAVSMAPGVRVVAFDTSASGDGLWILDSSGKVHVRGTAKNFGNANLAGLAPGDAVATIAANPSGLGYTVFTDFGEALVGGDAKHFGDLPGLGIVPNGRIVASAATPTGKGYYMLGADGGVFAFGDAKFSGSIPGVLPGVELACPIVGLVPVPTGDGYWLVACDGGVFAFGDAYFVGSLPGVLPAGTTLNQPVNGMVPFADGYLMVASDGGVFNFSNQAFFGSLGDSVQNSPIIAIAAFAG